MAQTVDAFATAAHEILAADPGRSGLEQLRSRLEELLQDQEFIAAQLTDDQPDRRVLYEDPALGFLVVGHVHRNGNRSTPHDHGSTWAIYGQAVGVTHMDEWEIVEPATEQAPGKVRLTGQYDLNPGEARIFATGALHSPWWDGPGKLVRIEGGYIDRSARLAYDPL